jgi:hypothetical protein
MDKIQIMVEVQYYSAFAMQILIVAVMIARRLFVNARYFFAYIVWQTFSVAIAYFLYHYSYVKYFYVYWINNAITISLGLAIIIELFNRMFDQYPSVRKFAKLMLLAAGAILILVSAALTLYHEEVYRVPILTLLVAERSLKFIQLGLIVALLALTRYLHLRWKNYLLGIALGFGFYALMALTGLTVLMHYGKSIARLENTLQGTAYCAAVLIWSVYVIQRESGRVPLIALPSQQLEKWDEVLREILSRKR